MFTKTLRRWLVPLAGWLVRVLVGTSEPQQMATQHVHVAVPDGYRDRLLQIIVMLRRLSPDYQRPERFHMDKDEIVHALKRLADA